MQNMSRNHPTHVYQNNCKRKTSKGYHGYILGKSWDYPFQEYSQGNQGTSTGDPQDIPRISQRYRRDIQGMSQGHPLSPGMGYPWDIPAISLGSSGDILASSHVCPSATLRILLGWIIPVFLPDLPLITFGRLAFAIVFIDTSVMVSRLVLHGLQTCLG